jgi:hypothetical protein
MGQLGEIRSDVEEEKRKICPLKWLSNVTLCALGKAQVSVAHHFLQTATSTVSRGFRTPSIRIMNADVLSFCVPPLVILDQQQHAFANSNGNGATQHLKREEDHKGNGHFAPSSTHAATKYSQKLDGAYISATVHAISDKQLQMVCTMLVQRVWCRAKQVVAAFRCAHAFQRIAW